MTAYTLADLEAAKAALERLTQADDNYSGNNPNKFRTRLNEARGLVRRIEAALKQAGEIALTPQEALERDLDRLFPDARSREIVTHEGVRYQRRFTPLAKSLSQRTVTEWDRRWDRLAD